MRFNVPAYGTWVLSDYITAGKQPACFHCSTLARTKAHTFGTFRHLDPNSTGCLDPEARNRPDHSDSIASGWPHRSDICPSATSPIGLLGRSRSFRVAVPPFESHLLLKHLVKGVGDDGGAGSAGEFAQGVEERLLGAVEHAQVELDLMGEACVERLGAAIGG